MEIFWKLAASNVVEMKDFIKTNEKVKAYGFLSDEEMVNFI